MACGVNAIKPQYSKNKIWPAGFHFIIKKLFITTIIANFAQIIIKGENRVPFAEGDYRTKTSTKKMKVMKFGGTSVGSEESILSLKRIVEAENDDVIVVVSALGGITDKLIETSKMAVNGNEGYVDEIEAMAQRHHNMIDAIIADKDKHDRLLAIIDGLLEQLRSIYYGVYLIRDLSEKTKAAIVSYGERLSSQIVATLIDGSRWYDSREFIKTTQKHGKHVLDSELTQRLVRETFAEIPKVSLVPGFISSDECSGETTNLGRGGSDYTAAIIAASLNAEVLEIWTDVDGFMTADPRVIHTAYTINELSYIEAMELCNFGAKVIYPPTIYPVCVKNIPIMVKNTFNPDAQGTVIKATVDNDKKPIKGISSINGTTLITVTGLSMVGVIGVNRRIFTALADNGISVFMVSQASSENSTSIGVRDEDADEAVNVLNREFAKEIQTGAMFPMHAESGLATIAIVGENMKHTPGIAGKLFGTLGRSGISVIACAQGASETNISFVVDSRFLRKSLIGMNIFNSVFVDCTASGEVAGLYQALLEHNVSVVAANKVAASSDYDSYLKLKETALRRGVKFLFETNVGAGLPIIGTINDLRSSGDKILKIEAVLSGTLNFIFNEISADVPFSETVRRAKEQGYSEPDPRIDLSGKDVVRKLVILAREAGYKVEQEDVEKHLFVPDEFFKGSIDDFWRNLPSLDAGFESRRKAIEADNKRWRFVAKMDRGRTSVSLEAVGSDHPFYNLEGSNNIIMLTTERYREYPMLIQGYGAGAGVTAAGVFANIMSIANI